MKDFLFVEKYMPNTVEECILPTEIKNTLREFRDTGNIPNLILSGSAGVGKTSSIQALSKDLDLDVLFINGSSEGRYLDTIRDNVVQFCSTASLIKDTNKKKLVLFDEFDNTRDDVQMCLRGVIEEFQSHSVFVFTVNNYSKVFPAIVSRCSSMHYTVPKVQYKPLCIELLARLQFILAEENITYDKAVLIKLIKHYFPDILRLFNEIQRFSIGGQLSEDAIQIITNDDLTELIEYMKRKNFAGMKKWVKQNSDRSPQTVFTMLYNALYGVLSEPSMAQAILVIADYQYKANFALNHEINLLSCILEIVYSDNVVFK
jgi:DNA polymerase III delta prime subunit